MEPRPGAVTIARRRRRSRALPHRAEPDRRAGPTLLARVRPAAGPRTTPVAPRPRARGALEQAPAARPQPLRGGLGTPARRPACAVRYRRADTGRPGAARRAQGGQPAVPARRTGGDAAAMTTRTPPKGTKAKTPKRLAVDDEARALIANPVFRAMLQEAKNTPPGDYIPLEELERRLGPVPAE